MQIYESYICDFCGKKFEDRDECERHEFFCEIKTLEKKQNTEVRMYDKNGNLLTLNDDLEVNDVAAIRMSDADAVRVVKNWFDYMGYCHPWDGTWNNGAIKEEKPGLVVYDENTENWYYPEDRIKETQKVLEIYSDRG